MLELRVELINHILTIAFVSHLFVSISITATVYYGLLLGQLKWESLSCWYLDLKLSCVLCIYATKCLNLTRDFLFWMLLDCDLCVCYTLTGSLSWCNGVEATTYRNF